MKINFKALFSKIQEVWKQYWIYIIIMLISAVVRSSPVSSGNPNLDETLNDISIGAFASALVAFLILLKDIQTEISKKKFLKRYTISPFLETVVDYMQDFCQYFNKVQETKTFLEWTKEFIVVSKNLNAEGYNLYCDNFGSALISIATEGKRIINNEVYLQNEEVLSVNECITISEICDLCKIAEGMISRENSMEVLININTSLCDQFAKCELLNDLSTIQYSFNDRIQISNLEKR